MDQVNPNSQKVILQKPFPSYEAITTDILKDILSFLSEKERVILSRVSTAWKAASLHNLDVAATKIKDLMENGSIKTLAKRDVFISSIISAHENLLILRCDRKKCVEVITQQGVQKIDADFQILYQNETLVLFKGVDEQDIVAVDKTTGNHLFTTPDLFTLMSEEDKKCFRYGLNIICCNVVSLDPFGFITVFKEGLAARWEFKDQQIHLIDYWFLESFFGFSISQEIDFALAYKDYLLASKEDATNVRSWGLYNLRTKRKLAHAPDAWANLSENIESHNYFIERIGPQVFQIKQFQPKLICSCYNLNDATKNWEVELENPDAKYGVDLTHYTFLIKPTDKWVFLKEGFPNLTQKVVILSATNGDEIATLSFKPDHFSELKARLYGSHLFIALHTRICVYDLENKKVITDVTLPQESTITDLFYSGEKLYLLFDHGHDSYTVKSIEHTKGLEKPFNPLSSAKAKTVAIALGFFALLAAAGALAFYFRGSINLSIGLGVTAFLGTAGSVTAGIYHLKHKK